MAITQDLIELHSEEERYRQWRSGEIWRASLEHWELSQALDMPTQTMERLIKQFQRWERKHAKYAHTLGELDWLFTKQIVRYLVEERGKQVLTLEEAEALEAAAIRAEMDARAAQIAQWKAEQGTPEEQAQAIKEAKQQLRKSPINQRKDK